MDGNNYQDMNPEIKSKSDQILQRKRAIEQKFLRQAQNYQMSLNRVELMHKEVVQRQTDLIGICQAEPKIISKYFLKFKPLSFNLATFGDLDRFGGAKMAFNNGKVYIGTIVNGKRHGKGVITCAKGKIYEGEMANNERQGVGVEIYSRGNFYYGSFIGNKRAGKGTMIWVDQNELIIERKFQYYSGEWKEGSPNGFGLHYSNGLFYLGEFKDGVKHGKAIQYSLSRAIFEGMFVNSNRDGKGVFIDQKQGFYEGEFKNGKKHGYGLWRSLENDSQYQGFFQNDKKDGIGVYQRHNQFYYRGMFTDDRPNGTGQYLNLIAETARKSNQKEVQATKGLMRSKPPRATTSLRDKVGLKSAELTKQAALKPRKQSCMLGSRQTTLIRSVSEKEKKNAKKNSFLSQRKQLTSAPSSRDKGLNNGQQSQRRTCRYKGCSCGRWSQRCQSVGLVDEFRLKRIFSSRKVILRNLM